MKYGDDQDPIFNLRASHEHEKRGFHNKRANEFSKSAHWATILLFFFSFPFLSFLSLYALRAKSRDWCTKPFLQRDIIILSHDMMFCYLMLCHVMLR